MAKVRRKDQDQLEAIKKMLILIAAQNGAGSKLIADALGVSEQWVRRVRK